MEKPGGKFIVVEGPSGSGKGIQVELLKIKFPGYFFDVEPSNELFGVVIRAIIERRPLSEAPLSPCFAFASGGSKFSFWREVSDIINKLISGRTLAGLELQMLYMADRFYNLEVKYLPHLEKGESVIIDRYFFSTLACGFSVGLDMEVLWELQKEAFASSSVILDNWKPDLLIIFDLDERVSMQRLKHSGKVIDIFEEKLERIKKVREGYRILATRTDLSKKTAVIDADRDITEIHAEVLREIESVLKPL